MENASKALLIAGAILIVILLIGIGMLIYSKSTGVVDTATNAMSDHEIQAFNTQFTPYEGIQTGSSIRNLVSVFISVFANKENGEYLMLTSKDGTTFTLHASNIDSTGTSTSSDVSDLTAKIDNSKKYKVTLGYKDGLVASIRIVEQ